MVCCPALQPCPATTSQTLATCSLQVRSSHCYVQFIHASSLVVALLCMEVDIYEHVQSENTLISMDTHGKLHTYFVLWFSAQLSFGLYSGAPQAPVIAQQTDQWHSLRKMCICRVWRVQRHHHCPNLSCCRHSNHSVIP